MDCTERQSQPGVQGQARDTSCTHCGELFTSRGQGRHISVRYFRIVTTQGCTNTTQALISRIKCSLTSIKIFNIVPKVVRPTVASALAGVLNRVADKNDFAAWEALLSFAPVVLQMPAKMPGGPSLAASIRSNFAAFNQSHRFPRHRLLPEIAFSFHSIRPSKGMP